MNYKVFDKYKNKKILIVGLSEVAFKYIELFQKLNCQIKITDIKHIFDLNKEIKKLKKLLSEQHSTVFGEHRLKDFLEADLIIHASRVDSQLKELQAARKEKIEVYDELSFPLKFLKEELILVGGSYGQTTIVEMIAFALRNDGKKVFSGGDQDNPLISYFLEEEKADYIVLEVSPWQLKHQSHFKTKLIVYPNVDDQYKKYGFNSIEEYMDLLFKPVLFSKEEDLKIVLSHHELFDHPMIKKIPGKKYWYTRKSLQVLNLEEKTFKGISFEERKIYSHLKGHATFLVNKTLIQGKENKENLLAAILVNLLLETSHVAIQKLIDFFPSIAHRLEFVVTKNKVSFFNHAKAENMEEFVKAIQAIQGSLIVIAGGKETEENFAPYGPVLKNKVRILILMGECKEVMNRFFADHVEACFLVGSFGEAVLVAYQKAKSGEKILLCPGAPSTDSFRDYKEKGKQYKKLIFQL